MTERVGARRQASPLRVGVLGAIVVIVVPVIAVVGVFAVVFLHGRPKGAPEEAVRAIANGNHILGRGSSVNGAGQPQVRETLLILTPRPHEDFQTFANREVARLGQSGWEFVNLQPTLVRGANFRLRALVYYEPISTFDPELPGSIVDDKTRASIPRLKEDCPACVVATVAPIVTH